jgi:ATP-dependent DNA ligase
MGPQRLVGGDILTAWPILRRDKRSSHSEPAPTVRLRPAERTIREVMRIKHLRPGFVIPAQPVTAARPPSGADWVHEIKHDGYRMIVRREGPSVRLYGRNAYDWTSRLATIAAAAERSTARRLRS